MSGVSNFARTQIRLAVFSRTGTIPTTFYVALTKTVPGATDTGSSITEPNTGSEYSGYARVSIANDGSHWDTLVGGLNTVQVTMPSPTGSGLVVVISGAALLDASSGGNLWFFGQLPSPLTVVSGATAPAFPLGDLSFDIF